MHILVQQREVEKVALLLLRLRQRFLDDILAVYKIGVVRPDVRADLPATPSGEASVGSGNDAAKVMQPGEGGSSSA